MFKKLKSLVLAAALALTTLSISVAQEHQARFAVDGFVLGTLVRVAEAKGYFTEEGVRSSLLTFSYGTDTVDAVLAGQADFGVIIDMPLLTRFPLGKLVSPALIGSPKPGWHKLYVPKDFEKVEDLRGKRIAIAAGTAQDFVTRAHLASGGLDPDNDVELIALPSLFEIIGAMKAGQVDAGWIWGQGPEQLGDDTKFKFHADDSIVPQKTTALLVVSSDYIEENRDGVVAVLKALNKAGADVANDLEGVAQIVAKGVAGDPAKIKAVINGQKFGLFFNAENVQAIKDKYEFLKTAGRIDPVYNLSDYMDIEALREAAPDKVSIKGID